MNKVKKLRVFLTSSAAVSAFTAISVFAEDSRLSGESLTLGERFEYALQGTVTGLLMVFAVLALLWGIVSLSKVIFYDIPRKRKANEEKTVAQKMAKRQINFFIIEFLLSLTLSLHRFFLICPKKRETKRPKSETRLFDLGIGD